MKFTFKHEKIGEVSWEDGRLSGPPGMVRIIRETAKLNEKRGTFFGLPLGPGGTKSYLKNPFSAYDFLLTFFHDLRIPVTISGEVPEPSEVPEGAVQ